MTERGPSIRDITGVIHSWQERVYEPVERTPQNMAARSFIEVAELSEVLREGGSPEEILGESIDIVIGSIGIALTVAEPKRVAEALTDKLIVMLHKYPPQEVEALKREGLSSRQALSTLKEQWGQRQTLFQA